MQAAAEMAKPRKGKGRGRGKASSAAVPEEADGTAQEPAQGGKAGGKKGGWRKGGPGKRKGGHGKGARGRGGRGKGGHGRGGHGRGGHATGGGSNSAASDPQKVEAEHGHDGPERAVAKASRKRRQDPEDKGVPKAFKPQEEFLGDVLADLRALNLPDLKLPAAGFSQK